MNEIVSVLFALAVSYPVGVALNLLARVVPIANRRSKVDLEGDPDFAAVKTSFETFFQISAGPNSWSYCYGIVAKHGYAVNVELFARLDIFSRSMMAASALVFLSTAAGAAFGRVLMTGPLVPLVPVAALVSFCIFLRAAQIYSVAFVRAIYEGFYSWYVDTRLGKRA